jgi:xylulokinase
VATTTLIGIDIGTTAVKAVLLDLGGVRLAEHVHPYPTARPAPGAAEQNPADWMAGVLGALQSFAAAHDLSGLAGIGMGSQVNTHVFVDATGKPLLPAFVWQDSRAAPDGAALEAQASAEQRTAWFGAPIPIDASHALSRLAYVRRVHPETFALTSRVLAPKDFCTLVLTGEVAADPISAVGLVDRDGYVGPLLDLVPGAANLLPPLYPISHVAGRVRSDLPCAGVPVIIGTMDAWSGMFGVGVVEDGDAMLQSGTSEIAGIVSSHIVPTPGVILFPPHEGITMHAAPTQTGGAAVAWFANVLGVTPAELSALAESAPPSSAVPLFLPHLEGERAPFWDSVSRGAFARMDGRSGRAELARSVLEGVAFSDCLAFEALAASAGRTIPVAHLGGGGSRSDFWSQVKADALGMTLRRAAVPDAAAVGAAILAGLGSGVMPSLHDAVRQLVRFDRTFAPDPSLAGYYADRLGHYRDLYESLRPFNARYGA